MGEIALDYDRLSDIDLATLVVRRDANAVRVITVRTISASIARPGAFCGIVPRRKRRCKTPISKHSPA